MHIFVDIAKKFIYYIYFCTDVMTVDEEHAKKVQEAKQKKKDAKKAKKN